MITRAFVARVVVVATIGTVALMAGPAANATDFNDVDTRNEWRNALAAASADNSGPHTITITGNFRVQAGDNTAYTGTQPLVIEGGGFTVRGTDVDEASGNLFLSVPGTTTPTVTVRNLTLREFVTEGAIRVANQDLVVESVTFVDNAAPEASIAGGIPTASAITSSGGLYIQDSAFRRNVGAAGAVNDLLNYSGPYLEDDGDVASSTLYNVTFRENVGEGAGGAILAASTDIDESLFVDNRSHVYGGAGLVVLDGGTIEDTIFRGNKAVDASDESVLIGSGGALSASGELTIDDSLFEENAAADGGAIDFLDDSAELLVVRGTRFKDNVATDSGGAIAAIAPVEIYDSVFAHNIAASGGAIHSQGLTIEGSLLRANEGTAGAGAVDATTVDGADIEIRNSTIAANKSDNHDAAVKIDVDDEEHIATLEFNTFVNNRGPEPQALEVNVEANGGFNLVGNAIANKNDNRDTCSFDFSEPATGITIAYNFDEDGTCTDGWAGTGNFGDGIDPKIDRLALNDGETRTAALLPGSPLINVVPEEYCDVETDQRGVARPVGSACDVGAYEYEPSVYVVPFTVPMDTGEITGVVAPAVAVGEIDWTATLPGTPPAGVTFPYGLGSFIIETASAGDTVTITLTFPSPINELWKVSDGTWTEVDALFSGNTATYEITDGGVLDEDGVADGFIVDPVAAGVAASFTG